MANWSLYRVVLMVECYCKLFDNRCVHFKLCNQLNQVYKFYCMVIHDHWPKIHKYMYMIQTMQGCVIPFEDNNNADDDDNNNDPSHTSTDDGSNRCTYNILKHTLMNTTTTNTSTCSNKYFKYRGNILNKTVNLSYGFFIIIDQ